MHLPDRSISASNDARSRSATASQQRDRREFLKQSALLGAGICLATGGAATAAERPNDKLNVAVVGIGGQGRSNLNAVGKQNVLALCDVDDKRAGDAYEKFPTAKKFYDFRKMLDALDSQIDAVIVATPDHTHFHPAYAAMQRGKHVYVEKPLAHSVWECRELTNLAAEKKLATQLGTQRHTLGGVRRTVELIKSGAIGQVREVHSWIGGSRGMPKPPTEFPPVPETLHWDLWLGPAAERPYSPAYAPYNWRFWWDFGTGETGNWGCHILDIPFWALDLKYPTKVTASGPESDSQRSPKSMTVQYDFPAEGKRPALKLHWYHGTPPILKELGIKGGGNNLFIGAEGMLLTGFGNPKLLPEEKFSDFKQPDPFLPKTPGHHAEWIRACRGGEPAACNFDYSGPLTETVLLGNVAYRAGGSFDWDAETLTATGNDQAAKYLRSHFREGWEA